MKLNNIGELVRCKSCLLCNNNCTILFGITIDMKEKCRYQFDIISNAEIYKSIIFDRKQDTEIRYSSGAIRISRLPKFSPR